MALLKKYYSLAATSLLESVIALTIISICLYISILIFAVVFTPRTAAKFYSTQNNINELFFMAQLQNDSLINENKNPGLKLEEEIITDGLKIITVHYKDSNNIDFEKSFYIQDN